MIENDFRAMFNKWADKRKKQFKGHNFEHKFVNTTRKKSIHYVRDFEPHQLDTLYEMQHSGIVYTISNQSFGKKPCDSVCLWGPSWIVIMFWVPRKTPHTFYMVNIDSFLRLIGESEKPYFNEEQIASVGKQYKLCG